MRVRHKVILQVSEDANLKNLLFETDETLAEVTINGYARACSGMMNVAAAGTESVPIGDVDAPKGLYLKADAACTIKINGSADGIALVPGNTTVGSTAKLFIEATITAVSVTAGVAALNLTFACWGDSA